MVTPVYKKDIAVFRHCSGGYLEFPTDRYKKDLLPVLQLHNLTPWITDVTKREEQPSWRQQKGKCLP